MTLRETLVAASQKLAGSSDTPGLDAELLMAHALGMEREELLLTGMNGHVPDSFDALVQRRAAGEPVAYIIGRRAFWTIDVEVAPGALIPRPDSETLIEAALVHFGDAGPKTILDLGTGPGTLLLAALDQWPKARGTGVDSSAQALAIAIANAERIGLCDRASFRQGDWAENIVGRFDLILCNPPYIALGADLPRDVVEWEPHSALFAGEDGLDAYRRLAPLIGGLLATNGIACIEIGAGQEGSVRALLAAEGLKISSRSDLGGHVRCLIISI